MKCRIIAVGVGALVAMSLLPSMAVAAEGSDLSAPANYPYHCDYRWSPGYNGQPGAFGPGGQPGEELKCRRREA